jgi:hypothetical protein
VGDELEHAQGGGAAAEGVVTLCRTAAGPVVAARPIRAGGRQVPLVGFTAPLTGGSGHPFPLVMPRGSPIGAAAAACPKSGQMPHPQRLLAAAKTLQRK